MEDKSKQLMVQLIIKAILTILFLLCLFDMPYGYFQAVRFIGMLGFVLLAYYGCQQDQKVNAEVVIYVALALLVQPFIKVALGRNIWNVVDIVIATGLILSFIFKPKNNHDPLGKENHITEFKRGE